MTSGRRQGNVEETLSESREDSGNNSSLCVDASTVLNDDELERALLIKQAVEEANSLKNLSDFQCAQLAIAVPAQEDIDKILERVYMLQCFREEYSLTDTVEDGMELVREFFEQQKGFTLSVDYSPSQGSYIMVTDYAKFSPSAVQTPHDWKVRVAGLYYLFQCCCSRIGAIREGLVMITECDGMGLQNFDQQLEERLMHELMSYYPLNNKESVWLNTPTIANLAYAIFKPLVSKKLLSTWRIGEKMDGFDGRIDTLFAVPTLEAATESILARVRTFLTERYNNEKHFRLTQGTTEDATTIARPPANVQSASEHGEDDSASNASEE